MAKIKVGIWGCGGVSAAHRRAYHTLEEEGVDVELVALCDINEDNFNREITVSEIAATLCVDPAYLTRRFTQKYGLSPKEYIVEKRIAHAKRLLMETDATVKEISVSVGYADQLYFSRIFKKKEGVSPQAYRSAAK